MYAGQFGRLGPDSVIASAATVTLPSDFVRVTGTTNIVTITPPPGNVCCVAFLVPTDGVVNTTAAGNIALAVAMAQNKVSIFTWSPVVGKWYPQI